MDGNGGRVLSRVLAQADDPKSGEARKRLLAAAAGLLDPARPGDGNQALMELGAALCTPRRPRCLLCPLRPGCRAAAQGDPERYPTMRPRRERERLRLVAAVVHGQRRDAGAVLLVR